MRARALGMPFLSRLATAFSPPGSLASSSLSRSSASFSAVVLAATSLLLLVPLLALDLADRLAHVCTDLSDVRLVDGLDVLTADLHDLEVRHILAPAAVGRTGGIRRFEHDRVVVVAVGHVQRDMPAVGLNLGDVEGPL